MSAAITAFRPRSVASRDVPSSPVDLAFPHLIHDLRNQMTVLMTCVEQVSGLVPEGGRERVTELQQTAHRAMLLTHQLMTAGPPMADRHPIDVNDIIPKVAAIVSRCIGPGIQLRLRVGPGPITVMAAPMEIERITLNLALNAVEAMSDGGVLTIETATTAGGAENPAGPKFARVVVTDTGPGLTPEVPARMFEPFFTTKKNGTGLGLSSVAYTVRQLGGHISISSTPGAGTAITVQVPCRP